MIPSAAVGLLRWLRRQLREPTDVREHLEAAVENGDPAEVRRLVRTFPFSEAQRRYVERLLDEWEDDLIRDPGAGRTSRHEGGSEP